MHCPNGCRAPSLEVREDDGEEWLHCNDCGANWTWRDISEYEGIDDEEESC